MAYRIDLFDSADKRVAILQDDILISCDLDLSIDGAPQVSITVPLDDDKAAYISPLYYLKIWNTTTAAYEFSVFRLIDPDVVDSDGSLQIEATYQGIITRLSKEHVDAYDTTSAGDTFENVVTALLAYQVNTPAITVGTLEPTPTVAIAAESSDIYSVLNSIRSAYGGWFEVDSSYRLNWFEDNTATPQRRIERRKNLKSLKYTPQYSQIINRVYAYGKGEGDARINLTDAGEANEYIDDAASQALYGISARQKIDKSITHPTTLLGYAQRTLALYKDPPHQYSVNVLNLAEIRDYDYSLESLGLDTRVRVVDDLLKVDVNTSIVSMSINLLAPEEISIDLSTIKTDISDLFGDILSIQDVHNSVATQIGAGQVTVLGTFVVQDWVTAGQTTIDGGNITANTITVDQIQSGVLGNKTYRQAAEPLNPESGDIWLDTDDGNKMWRYDGAAWVETQDAEIGTAISDAAGAQATADGKVVTFYQAGIPTSEGIGDLWVDTDDGNKLYRAESIGADQITAGEWVEIQDTDIAQAISDASDAQSTADGKIVTFYQDEPPTAEGTGDLWFDTNLGNKQYRWSGSAWVASAITPAQTVATINLDGGTVQINGNQISINGDTTFAANYDPSGKITTGGGAADVNANVTTISGGKITTNTIEANTLKTSTMTARTITLDGATSILKGNYAAGSAGWQIDGDGNAEFNDVTVRGTIGASTIEAGKVLTISGDIATSDGKFEIKTTGVQLKSTAGDTTYIDLVQDTAQIYLYDAGTQRLQISPSGNIRLDSDAGIPIAINSTSDADCVDILTAVANRRGIVCRNTPGSTLSGYATIHATNTTTNGYALYAGGKAQVTGEALVNSLSVTVGSSLHAVTLTGDLTFVGAATTVSGLVVLNSTNVYATTIRKTASASYLSVAADVHMRAYDLICDDITCDDITLDRVLSAVGNIEVLGNISMTSYTVYCSGVSASTLSVSGTSTLHACNLTGDLKFTSASYGLHFNNDSSNTVLYSGGLHLYFRDSSGTVHTLV